MATTLAIPIRSNLSHFEYEPLPSPSSSIRLAVLHPGDRKSPVRVTLQQATFASRPKYRALSYTWGAPDVLKVIKLNGKSFRATQNLWEALVHLRHETEEQTMWIDAICIDQSNVQERNQQVGLMAYIYTRAERVIVWLGTLKLGTTDPRFTFGIEYDGFNPGYLVSACMQPYWSRVWIVQEIGAAAEIEVHWEANSPNSMAEVENFAFSWNQFFALVKSHKISAELPKKLWDQRERRHGDAFLLPNLMNVCRESRCAEPRDKIYEFVGIAHDCQDGSLAVDYSKALFEVYEDVVRFHYKSSAARDGKAFTDVVFFSQLVQQLLGGKDALEKDLLQWTSKAFPDPAPPFASSPSFFGSQLAGARDDPLVIAGLFSGRIAIIGPTYDDMMGMPDAMKMWKVSLSSCKTNLERLRRKDEGFMRTLLGLDDADLRKVVSLATPLRSRLSDRLLSHLGFAKDHPNFFAKLPRITAAPVLEKPLEDHGPRLFATTSGVIGMVPSSALMGDLVFQYMNSDVVAIARLDDSNTYCQIVGRAVIANEVDEKFSKFQMPSDVHLPGQAGHGMNFDSTTVQLDVDMLTLHLLTC